MALDHTATTDNYNWVLGYKNVSNNFDSLGVETIE